MASSQQLLLGQVAQGGYQISRSLRFNSADSAYLNRTPASAGNRKTWTWSGWIKRSSAKYSLLFAAGNTNDIWNSTSTTQIGWGASTDSISIYNNGTFLRTTTQVFRDFSAWGHLVVAIDTTQATAANRVKMYWNGEQITAFSTSNDPTQNLDTFVNATHNHVIGGQQTSVANSYFSGYLTEINFIDGSALDPTSFGEFNIDTGVWQPKKYTGSYSGNSFYLNFSDNSGTTSTTLGKDSSGLGNNWTPNNFSVTAGAGNDSLVDTPTNYGTDTGVGGEVRGNYATWNPLVYPFTNGGNGFFLADGNLQTGDGTDLYFSVYPTIVPKTGKWYVEKVSTVLNSWLNLGITTLSDPSNYAIWSGVFTPYLLGGGIWSNNSGSNATSYGVNDIISMAVDLDNRAVWFAKNGSWIDGNGSDSSATVLAEIIAGNTSSAAFTWAATVTDPTIYSRDRGCISYTNFGQRPFAYTAPSGFKALCTQNLPDPVIKDGGDYFNTILYTGTGSSNARTGVGFQPDLVWIKERNASADHALYDVLRGVQNQLESNTTTAETAEATGLTAFGTDGFTVGALAQLNTSGDTYVAWNWKANGAGSSNTAGTITSTVSVNTTSGFSIVTWTATNTAATIGHGLGVAPAMIIVKSRADVVNWTVYHQAIGNTGGLVLNGTNAVGTNIDWWNNTSPTSSVFSVGPFSNYLTGGHVAYCFAPVAGYSAMSSFTGNGSADGPFIFTNHRPAFVLIKRTDTTSNWTILDFQREGYNVDNDPLYPNLANAEGTTDLADLLSNGFKLRTTDASVNASGGTYIYMSLASNPFKYSLAR